MPIFKELAEGKLNLTQFKSVIFNSVVNQPITRRQILDWSKQKQSADDNVKFDENIIKFSKWAENTVGKAEIARYQQFLLFPQCFQKACFPGASKGVIVWEWVKKQNPMQIPPELPQQYLQST